MKPYIELAAANRGFISPQLVEAWKRFKPANQAIRLEVREDEATLLLYDTIGFDFWSGDGTTAKDVVKQLSAIKAPRLRARINSPGGDVFEGMAIWTALNEFDGEVIVQIDGLAASAAAVIAMAGDRIEISPAGRMMIHRAWGMLIGNATDALEFAATLEGIDQQIADLIARKTGKSAGVVMAALDAESWYSPEEAIAFGLADSMLPDKKKPDEEDPEEEDPYASAEARQRAAAAARAKLRLRELEAAGHRQ